MKKLSIVTINFNNSTGLQKTIESVISQNFRDFQYIVVDGNSLDDSLLILEKYSKNIDQVIAESDNGIYHAMNKGIKLAQGEYLLFLNSGDVLISDNVLDSVSKYLNEFDIIFADLIWRDGLVTCYPEILNFSFLKNRSLAHQATFIKKDLFKKYGYYDEGNKITSDWKFFILCICKYNVSYKKISFIISKMEPGGISDSKARNTSKIIFNEKNTVLNSEFKSFLDDYDSLNKINSVFRLFRLKFWKRFFSKYRKSTAVSEYDW